MSVGQQKQIEPPVKEEPIVKLDPAVNPFVPSGSQVSETYDNEETDTTQNECKKDFTEDDNTFIAVKRSPTHHQKQHHKRHTTSQSQSIECKNSYEMLGEDDVEEDDHSVESIAVETSSRVTHVDDEQEEGETHHIDSIKLETLDKEIMKYNVDNEPAHCQTRESLHHHNKQLLHQNYLLTESIAVKDKAIKRLQEQLNQLQNSVGYLRWKEEELAVSVNDNEKLVMKIEELERLLNKNNDRVEDTKSKVQNVPESKEIQHLKDKFHKSSNKFREDKEKYQKEIDRQEAHIELVNKQLKKRVLQVGQLMKEIHLLKKKHAKA